MKLIAAIALTFSANAFAGDFVLHTVSHHSSRNYDLTHVWRADGQTYSWHTEPKYNNNNFGFGYRSDNGWTVGVYDNSYHKTTAYVGKEWMYNQYFGAEIALVTGYDIVTQRPVALIGGLIVRFPIYNGIKGNILLMPPVANTDGVAHLALSYPF